MAQRQKPKMILMLMNGAKYESIHLFVKGHFDEEFLRNRILSQIGDRPL